jgi:hypothetical protein
MTTLRLSLIAATVWVTHRRGGAQMSRLFRASLYAAVTSWGIALLAAMGMVWLILLLVGI